MNTNQRQPGSLLRLLRIANDMSKQQVADQLNISTMQLSEIESNYIPATNITFEQIGATFHMSSSEIESFFNDSVVNNNPFHKSLLSIFKKLGQENKLNFQSHS
jgi:transcriptional regulator with XRE-family HTH domain